MTVTIPSIFFTKDAFQQMSEITRQAKHTETGGLLLGKLCNYQTGRAFVICKVTGPGPRAVLAPDTLQPDITYYRRMRLQNSHLRYLGEWHKHIGGHSNWSHRDLAQALDIFAEEAIDEILCPICTTSEVAQGIEQINLQCFYLHNSLQNFIGLSYSIIEDIEDNSSSLHYLAVEESVVRKFLASQQPYRVLAGDSYPTTGVAHLYASPFKGNQAMVLVNTNYCQEIEFSADVNLAITVAEQGKKMPKVRGYHIDDDEISHEIATELISPSADIFSRNRGLLETSLLKNKTVGILGLGSVGSAAALELTRAGVGNFVLIDKDTLSIENLCRHVCDLSELGMTKVDAVKSRINRILPSVKVAAYQQDSNVDPDATRKLCRNVDILLVATDTVNSMRLANWIGHYYDIPIIFSGLFTRAIGGRVWRVIPGETACYQCYPGIQDTTSSVIAYSEATSPQDLTVQPGLGNDIAFITQLAVKFILDTLKSPREIKQDIVFWFNQKHESWKVQPLTLYKIDTLPKNSQCSFCITYETRDIKEECRN